MTQTPPSYADHLGPALARWLPRQRWFSGKGQPFGVPRLVHRVPYSGHTACGYAELLVVEVLRSQPGAPDHYLVPVVVRQQSSGQPAASVIASTSNGVVHDALADPQFVAGLAGDLLAGRPGTSELDVRTGPGSLAAGPYRGGVRALTGEQSNTSVVVGDVAVLKVFRRLRPGDNPEREMLDLLTSAAEHHVPPLLASLDGPLDGGSATYGILQRYLPDATDGWTLALASAATAIENGTAAAAEGFAAEAFRIGEAVASVHRTLARIAPTAPLTRDGLTRTARRMGRRLAEAVRAAPQLAPLADALGGICDGLAHAVPAGHTQRLHGDLHLGQLLRTTAGWSLIDFEGEPERSFHQRRALEPVAKDIAGLLRSFDYAAHHQLLHGPPPPGPERAAAAQAWAQAAQRALCEGYTHGSGHDPRTESVLLHAHLMDKAVYEVLYEIRNRPGWTPIPVRALARLAGQAAPADGPGA